jgi:hypothetical protein
MLNFLPRHLRKPGEDGYRTPTIEDSEHPAHHGIDTSAFTSTVCDGSDHPMDSGSQVHCAYHHFGHNPHYCHRRRHSEGLPFEPPTKLSWKQRIKHVTWAYFTVTMATGGIANVLSTSNLDGHMSIAPRELTCGSPVSISRTRDNRRDLLLV